MKDIQNQLKEFRPTIIFLGKFFAIYLIGNLLYGAWITNAYPKPDVMTTWVTEQSSVILNVFGWETKAYEHRTKPTTYIATKDESIVAVYEGCNGLNVVIVFLAFLMAFGPYTKKLFWFIPLGLIIIHLSNLTRIVLLAMVSVHMPNYLYFTHKYLFTAFIYFFVFLLWMWWVMKLAKQKSGVDEQVA